MSGRQGASSQAQNSAQQQQQQSQQSIAPITSLIPKSIIGNAQTPAAVATAVVKNKINYVQVDALVLLKIVKHCHEMGGGAELSQGILTGMVHVQDGAGKPKRLEITNCFPLPSATNLKTGSNESYDEAYEKLLTDNLKNFRHLNIDHLIVGWYQSSLFGTFISKEFVESHFMYQDEIGDSIVLVYDPFKSQNGSLLLKAYRLLPNMMELLKKKEFSVDNVKELKLNHENFMEELPVVIKNSHLVNSLLCEIQEMQPQAPSKHFNFLDLSTSNVLEKNIRSLIENVDELTAETNKFINYHKQLQKANHQKQQMIQKREAENSARQARGEPPLPEEDYSKLYKMVQPTSRLEPILISSQIKNYCQQMNEFISLSFSNMFIAEALQNK